MPYPRLAALYAACVAALLVTLASLAPRPAPKTTTGALAAPPSHTGAARAQAAGLLASFSVVAAAADEPEPADAGRDASSLPIRMP